MVLFTFIFAMLSLPFNNRTDKLLLSVLSVCLVNEIASCFFIYYDFPRAILTTVTTIVHHSLWLALLTGKMNDKRNGLRVIVFFLILSVVNLLFGEGGAKFNYYTFVIGAYLYIAGFILLSYRQIRDEHIAGFLAPDYVLLFAPVTLFYGLSFMFAFQSKTVTSSHFLGIKLYDLIVIFVNAIYYTTIAIYILGKRKNVWTTSQ